MRISSSEKFPKTSIAIGGGLLSVLMLAGCSDSKPPVIVSALSAEDLASAPVTTVKPGESRFIQAIDPTSGLGADILTKLPNDIDYLYPNGPHDSQAPTLTNVPTRFRAEVVLQGASSNYLANDAACDTYNIGREVQSVGALALGGVDEGSFIVWPTKNGEPVDRVEVCYFQKSEPSNGVILFTK